VIRRSRGLDLSHLSDRLAQLGQPVSVDGLSKIELGTRRVDVDDLMALALALDVTPNRLMLPAEANDQTTVRLTPADEPNSARQSWAWACGEAVPMLWGQEATDERALRFQMENRPHDPPDETTATQLAEWAGKGVLDGVADGYAAAREAGVPPKAIASYLGLRERERWRDQLLRQLLPDETEGAAR
jgi:transcriptional regulator with XRE-family HTH domain